MKMTPLKLRSHLMLFTAITVATGLAAAGIAHAQTSTPVAVPGDGSADSSSYDIEKVKIQYKKLILREKDIPNAVSVLTQKDIQAENPTTGSIQTLLTKTPSVVSYTQSLGQNEPTLAIRGVRNDELGETLDGVPINSLLAGSGDYLSGAGVGSPVTLNEIDGVTVYPGLATPEHQGFSTAGGTIAYTTKQPTDDRYEELEGGFGSFDTQHFGFTVNTGKLGDGPDAPKVLMLYDQSETAGYVENTPARYHNFLFNAVKPYDNGLSKVGLVVIYNDGQGLVQTLPAPIPLADSVGQKFNFPISKGFFNQSAQFLTTILSDETYINKYAIFDGSLFFKHQSNASDSFENPNDTSDTYTPNVQGIYQFYGCVGGGPTSDGLTGPQFTYDPSTSAGGNCAAGESDEYSIGHNNVVGITPKLTLFPDDHNTIVIGGLIAKASSGAITYVYGGDSAKQNEDNGYNSYYIGGGEMRTIFSGYVQDTIRLFDNKLQITPGVKVDAAYSDNIQQTTEGIYNPLKLQNFTKIGGYYLGASYNLPHNLILFGSLGKGSLFAPVGDYSEGTTTAGAPTGSVNTLNPEIVHLFEGGLRYDTPRLYLSADYYYQSITDGFAFFQNFLTNAQYYGNTAGYLFRGVEASGEYRVTPELSIFGNGAYDKTQYTTGAFALDTLAEDQFGYAFPGTPLSNVPDWTGTVGIDYDYGPFSSELTGQYTGREFITDDLDAPPYGNTCTVNATGAVVPCSGSAPKGETKIPANPLDGATVTDTKVENPANFIVNLLLSYKIPVHDTYLKSLTATLNVTNLLGEKYYSYEYSAENPVQGIYDPHLQGGMPYDEAFFGQPRTILLDLVARF
jgi:iron complex outermembrane receptor protein